MCCADILKLCVIIVKASTLERRMQMLEQPDPVSSDVIWTQYDGHASCGPKEQYAKSLRRTQLLRSICNSSGGGGISRQNGREQDFAGLGGVSCPPVVWHCMNTHGGLFISTGTPLFSVWVQWLRAKFSGGGGLEFRV